MQVRIPILLHVPRRSFSWGRVATIAVVHLLVVVTLFCQALAQEAVVSREYAIKAGVIAVLGKCVTWPADAAPAPGEPLSIGILGKDPFVENGVNQLDRMVAEQKRKGIPIVVKRFNSAKDYQPCHILFVANQAADGSEEKSLAARLDAAQQVAGKSTVLVVGESADVARQGAVANLMFDRATNLIRLEINPDAAARAGLKLAPDLLRMKLVQIVRDSQTR
ncbi:MAG: YfiR family protein [Pirellulales bacterium]